MDLSWETCAVLAATTDAEGNRAVLTLMLNQSTGHWYGGGRVAKAGHAPVAVQLPEPAPTLAEAQLALQAEINTALE